MVRGGVCGSVVRGGVCGSVVRGGVCGCVVRGGVCGCVVRGGVCGCVVGRDATCTVILSAPKDHFTFPVLVTLSFCVSNNK